MGASGRNAKGDFNPRSLHGERRWSSAFQSVQLYFNPRSLHGERRRPEMLCIGFRKFQSTLPARGATYDLSDSTLLSRISIHAPCTGSDAHRFQHRAKRGHFNPRSLHGERRHTPPSVKTAKDFNPRSLHGERRSCPVAVLYSVSISIHAPCTGSDRRRMCSPGRRKHFNPRSLHGERHSQCSPHP